MITVGGKLFSDEHLARITTTARAEPGLSRRQLSLRVCEWLDWRNPAGRWQAMSCRKALLELQRRGLVELPAVTKTYGFSQVKRPAAPPPVAEVSCTLEELGPVELVLVRSGSPWARLWRELLDAHHYLKSGPLCGAQLRYLIRSERYGWLGGLSYSACALRVESRDAWIGWTEEGRKRNHILVVNNSRFLIAPSVKVANLASHVLARCEAGLGADWQEAYGYRPVLLETYVERGRFAGTCYRAANWRQVGVTSGRGRPGTGATIKDVYVKPLVVGWQALLCREADGTVRMRAARRERRPRDWVEAELGGVDLGDARLTARLLQMTGMFYAKPTANIPEACGSLREAKAAYRFLDNARVDWQALLGGHYEATVGRIQERKGETVLVAQDTTTLNYSHHPHTTGLGPIGTEQENIRGLMIHDTLAFTPQGTPLGLLQVQGWAREGIGSRYERHEKPLEEKESFKWVESYRAVSAVQAQCRGTRLVVVGDREADIHELFVEQQRTTRGAELLIRAERTRQRRATLTSAEASAESHEHLWELLAKQTVIGERELLVPPSEKRAARVARLAVRTQEVTLRAPKRKSDLPAVRIWAVYAKEEAVPAGVEGLEWLLLTTVAVKEAKAAYERLEWYARRWGIEVYHRILKSGCRVEARQMEQARRLYNCLAIDMVVAWRIYYLTNLGEETPEVPCTVYFTETEWKALTTFVTQTKKPPETPPSLNEAVRLLGQLGGHLGRKGDGHPGSEVLWRGMARLTDIENAYVLYH